MRLLMSLLLLVLLVSEAHAVRLADGAAVGQLIGYSAACMRNVGLESPSSNEDKQVGKSYAMWLKNNLSNPGRAITDMQNNLGIGMAAAARNDYANCEGVLLEMIGFYEFFQLKGTGFYPGVEKYRQAKTASPAPATSQGNEANEPPLGMFVLENDFTKSIMKMSLNEDGDLLMAIKSTSTFGIECTFQGMCDVNGAAIECNQAFANSDKIVTVTGQIVKGNIELFSASSDSVCQDGGIIDGIYIKKK